MAYQINLLPWREKERTKHKHQFVLVLIVVIVLAAMIQWRGFSYLHNQHSQQAKRNGYLEAHIERLDRELIQLNTIKKQYQERLQRLTAVEELQQNKNKTTQLLNTLPEIITEGIYLNRVRIHERRVELNGVSDSHAHLASMLDKLEQSQYITSVKMHSIVSERSVFDSEVNRFDVSFSLLPFVGFEGL